MKFRDKLLLLFIALFSKNFRVLAPKMTDIISINKNVLGRLYTLKTVFFGTTNVSKF